MKYIDEFRKLGPALSIVKSIEKKAGNQQMTFMEVCGTHTMAIARSGIRQMLPENINLISGPGCPVCVTPNSTIDYSIELARRDNVIITTFGDMMRVPGSYSSLAKERAKKSNIKIVTSTIDALEIARQNPHKKVVFIGVGFETTAPTIAASILIAEKENIKNYFVLSAHKVMPPPMDVLSRGDIPLNGYICPGHVSAIIGSKSYDFLPEKYGIACVVAGFEPLDILKSIDMLADQVARSNPSVETEYKRVVTPEGNIHAKAVMNKVFEEDDSEWRGIGVIPKSGLKIRSNYKMFDAEEKFSVDLPPVKEAEGCLCGEVLQGKVIPTDCPLFGSVCNPSEPVGPCMVSTEGTCAAYYKYLRSER